MLDMYSSSITVSCCCGCLLLVCNVIVCIIRTRCFVSISFVSAKHRQQSQRLFISYQLNVLTSARLHIVPYYSCCCCCWIIENIGDVIVADVIVVCRSSRSNDGIVGFTASRVCQSSLGLSRWPRFRRDSTLFGCNYEHESISCGFLKLHY